MKHTKRVFVVAFSFFICLNTFGQKNIENNLTPEHKNIKGTKISLIPPAGFSDSSAVLQHAESGAVILIIDFPFPYSAASQGFTKKVLSEKGFKVNKIEKLIINGFSSKFITGTVEGTQVGYYLVLGSSKETILIIGTHPKKMKNIGQEIKKSMLTAYYEMNKKINPFEEIDYSIDVSETRLKFANTMMTTLIFTEDGTFPSSSEYQTSLLVGKSLTENLQDDRKEIAISNRKKVALDIDCSEKYIREISIDGINGYEMYEKGTLNGDNKTKITLYYVTLFDDNGYYYILCGFTGDPTDESMDEMQKAIKTFKRK